MIVSKFGGTSVGSYEAMERSARIIASHDDRRLIVISATAGTTNDLVALSEGNLESTRREEILNRIEQRHLDIISQSSSTHHLDEAFQKRYYELRAHIDQSAGDKRWKDRLYAFGEQFSTLIFQQILKDQGVEVELLDARTVIKTNSDYGNAEPDLAKIQNEANANLQKEKRYLTQGFIGSDSFGHTTTLGRGGSDFSAALFAEAVEADTLEIWTDVAGVFTTDPRIVPDAFPIHEISFDEAAELSVFGGKVLHPATLKPAQRAGVKVKVLSSREPEQKGTAILKEPVQKPAIRAISLRKEQTLLTVKSLDMLHQHGFLAQIFKILADHRISVDLVTTSEVSVSLTLDTAFSAAHKVELSEDVLNDLREFAEVTVEKDLALIALIGNHLQQTSGISGPLFTELKGHNIRLICHGASSNNLCFLVREREAEDIVRLLHQRFIQKETANIEK